jgi:hypothetical protein
MGHSLTRPAGVANCTLLALAAGLFVMLPGSRADKPAAADDGRPLRVLFVGNSLTAGNDLPNLVQAMAAAGGKSVRVHAVVIGGASLEDHWQDGRAREALASARWDFVVLQQGPSSRPESQRHLREWARRWAAAARRRGATPALYMVWPFQGQRNGFALVSQSYRAAAEASKARILPAGEAWQEALRRDATLALYQQDGLHPTPAGTYLAALVITHGLTGVKPGRVPARLKPETGPEVELPEEQAGQLRQAAEKVQKE